MAASLELEQLKAETERAQGELEGLQARWREGVRRERDEVGVEVPMLKMEPMRVRKTLKGHFGKVTDVCWNPVDSTQLISASQDGSLVVWDGMKQLMVEEISLDVNWVMTCEYAPTGQQVACGGLDNTCSLFDLNGDLDQPSARLQAHDGYLTSIKFMSEQTLITGSGDSTAIVWDLERECAKTIFAEHTLDVIDVAVRDDASFYSGGCDCTVRLWDTRTSSCMRIIECHDKDVNAISVLAGGNLFVTASDDSYCRLFDQRYRGILKEFKNPSFNCGVTSCDLSKSGRFLFAGYSNAHVLGWDLLTGDQIPIQDQIHSKHVSCVSVSPDGLALAAGSWDTTLSISA